MASEPNLPAGTARLEQPVLPYAPGWIDRLVGWINHLPVSFWLFYPALTGIFFLMINVSRWVDGLAPFGAFDSPFNYAVLYPVFGLAAIHYLDRTASRAFDSFRPALGGSDAQAARLRYELTILPAREAWVVGVAGLAFTALVVAGLYRPQYGLGFFLFTVISIAIIGFVTAFELVYHTVRQLRLVSRIHEAATNVDLFHLAPLYSFSALTARTGVVFLLVITYDVAANPETLLTPSLIGLNVVVLLLSIACFILPLQGMQRRIAAEKRRLEWEVNQRLKAMSLHLYARVDALDVQDADPVNKTITSLLATRDLIVKIPTWPWRPETFTIFFSAFTLPVIVYLIQIFLKGLIGLK